MSGAIALAPKPSQKRPQKIVCPMCETVGYAPIAASGKDVRCPNRKCMVPVFTAPDFAAPKREEIEKPSSKGTVLVIVAVAAVVLLGGFAYWWTKFRIPSKSPQSPIAKNGPIIPNGPVPSLDNPKNTPSKNTKKTQEQPKPSATLAEVRQRALAEWPQLTSTLVDLRSRPLRLRYAAESYAIVGDIDAARAMIGKFDAGENPFYRIGPLVEIAWAQAAAGAENATTISALRGLANEIPVRGFDPARNVILYAAAIVGNTDAAPGTRQLVRRRRDSLAGERLLARLEAAAALAHHDLDANFRWRPVLAWNHPKAVAVGFNLARHGRFDAALHWGQGAPTASAQAETIAAWAEGQMVGQSRTEGVAAIQQAAKSLDPAVALYGLARAGIRSVAAGDQAAAKTLLTPIQATVEQIAASSPISANTAGQLFEIDLAATDIERARAASFAEAAHLATLLGKKKLAATYLWRGVDHLRAAAPPVAEVAARVQEFATVSLAGIRGILKSELDLSDAAAEDAATAYRRNLGRYRDAAARAQAERAALIARGIGWGLGTSIASEITTRSQQGAALLAGPAGGQILAAFERSANTQAVEAIRKAGVTDQQIPPISRMRSAVWALIEQGKFREAGTELGADTWEQLPEAARLGLAIRIVSRLVRDGHQSGIGDFLSPMSRGNQLLLNRHWGAVAAANRKGMALLDELKQDAAPATIKAAALRGMAAGWASLPASSKDTTPTSTKGGKKKSET